MRAAAAGILLAALAAPAVLAPAPARAQDGAQPAAADSAATALHPETSADSTQSAGVIPTVPSIGTPDSVFQEQPRSPIIYSSSYDRDRTTGTWTQSANYSLRRGPLSLNLSGGSATIDDILRIGFAGRGGNFSGQINYRAAPRLIFTMDGRYTANSAGDPISGTQQHRNRLAFRSQYSTLPWKGLTFQALLSTEFQEDENLSYRPLATTNPAFSQRDSTSVTGRQDGLTAQLDWKPVAGFSARFQGGGSRLTPVTRTITTSFLRGSAGGGQTDSVAAPIETPITNSNFLANFGFTGIPKLTTGLQLKRSENSQEYFDSVLRGQEHSTNNQQSGLLHLTYQPIPFVLLTTDGTLSRTLREYRLRTTSTSLVNTQDVATGVSVTRPRTQASVRLEITRSKSERQVSQNGISLTRALTATASQRVSRRLSLDGSGTATLTSYRYDYAAGTTPFANDRDQLRTFFNVGGGYGVSARCSTTVHFSTIRSHTVAIGTQASADNAVQTTYQMNATMLLRLNPNFTINQNYLLSAVYQIYDYSEGRNLLSRIRRIDTTASDTLFPWVYVSVVHNFLFRDVGPYVSPSPGAPRLYNVSSRTYQQNLGATFGVVTPAGINAFVTQNLGNTRDRALATGTEDVTNRWTLSFGGDMTRALSDGTEIRLSARHQGAYSERPPAGTAAAVNFDRQEESYWIVNASVLHSF